jgi:hypothetical protein
MKRYRHRRSDRSPRLAAGLLVATALLAAGSAAAQSGGSYAGRPVYSEPGAGLQLPPNCSMEPTWRQRLASSDLEVWVVNCNNTPHTWLLKRSLIEMVSGNQARLRFQILDDRSWPGESAGDSLSVQCTGRNGSETGFVVQGARWKAAGTELRLAGAQNVIRADAATQKFVAASLAQIECVRYPEREAMLRRLNRPAGR